MADASRTLILALGDSLTAGYGLRPDEALPARLEAALLALGHPAAVVNAGVSGDTTAAALARLPRVLSRLDRRPDLAIVELGANDLIRRVPPAATRANLSAILRELDRCGIPALIASFEPPPFLAPLAAAYAGMYETLAREHGARLNPFFPPGVAGDRAHVLRDRLHPNAAAIVKVAAAMAPAVLAALQAPAPRAQKPADA